MTNFVFNVAKGRMAAYLDMAGTNDAIVIVPIETTGLEAQSVLEDKTTLAAVLSGTTNEQTTLGRKSATSVTAAVDHTNNRYYATVADQTWVAASGNTLAGVVVCYDPDTTSGTDADIIPLTYHDWPVAPAGSDLTISLVNFYQAV